ncbi:MAG: MASE3 domain-containing protein [Caulobacteraceae bacterium]
MIYVGSSAAVKQSNGSKYTFLAVYFLILISGFILSHFLFLDFWVKQNNMMHIIIELLGMSFIIFSFVDIWNAYEEVNKFNQRLGVALLIFIIINSLHIFNYADYIRMPASVAAAIMDVSIKYSVLIAYCEVIVLLLLSFHGNNWEIPRWLGLTLSLTLAFVFLWVMIEIARYIPMFYDNSYTTSTKFYIDIVLCAIPFLIIAAYANKSNESKDEREKVMFRYIIIAVCFFISSRLCFVFSTTTTSPMQFFGHLLKLAYYYFIYHGVYKTTIDYPYMQVKSMRDYYKNLLNVAPIGIITFDSFGKLNYLNRQCEVFFNNEVNKLYGATFEEFIGSLEILGLSRSKLLEEMRNIQKEPIVFYGAPVYNGIKGTKLIFNVVQMDSGLVLVTRDAKKAQAIENMQLQTQTLLDSIDNILFIVDINKKIAMCNKKFMEVTGIKQNDVDDISIYQLFNMLKLDVKETDSMDCNHEGMTKGRIWNIQTISGILKKISVDCSPIHDIDNEKIGWIIVGRDVTESAKEQERAMQREKMALIGHMAAGLVHEIKNPLASIKGLCQLILSKAKHEKITDYAAVMENAVDDINKIVSDFLQFSRPTVGELEKTNINDLLRSLEIIVSTNAYKNGVMTQFCYCMPDKPILLNKQQIKNVILSMVDNAIDAMNGAIDPRLIISTDYYEMRNEIHLSIKDNGMGMTEEQLANVGTPFYTTKSKGTGLGISICKNIISEHGGSLKIESSLGEGSVFTIILPCID